MSCGLLTPLRDFYDRTYGRVLSRHVNEMDCKTAREKPEGFLQVFYSQGLPRKRKEEIVKAVLLFKREVNKGGPNCFSENIKTNFDTLKNFHGGLVFFVKMKINAQAILKCLDILVYEGIVWVMAIMFILWEAVFFLISLPFKKCFAR